MFPFPIATPQGCNIQTFYGPNSTSVEQVYSWAKPEGVSHVYMMLIGAGANGDGATGGGSGAVTVWYGAAQHVPNSLLITPGSAPLNTSSVIGYKGRSVSYILYANSGTGLTGGTAQTAGPFAASGFYKSTAGQDGASGSVTVSSTTFLSGGAGSSTNSVIANYGYTNANSTGSGTSGFFQLQPIIIGVGGSGVNRGGIGCGGGGTGPGIGGPGMILIASW
jgi:hypothetical protein